MATSKPLEVPVPDPVAASPWPTWPAADADHLLVTGTQMAELESQLFTIACRWRP